MSYLLLGMGKEALGREECEGRGCQRDRKEALRSDAQRRARPSWAAGPLTSAALVSVHRGAPDPGHQRAQPEPARRREGGGEREKGQARRASAQLGSGKGAEPLPPGCGRPRCWRCSAAPRVSSERSRQARGGSPGLLATPARFPLPTAPSRPVPAAAPSSGTTLGPRPRHLRLLPPGHAGWWGGRGRVRSQSRATARNFARGPRLARPCAPPARPEVHTSSPTMCTPPCESPAPRRNACRAARCALRTP